MSWSVEYLPSTERELANLWNNGPDRAAVAAAANRLDQALQHNPLELGEARAGNTRIAFDDPLAILFDVNAVNQHLAVWDVWRWPPLP
jgi:hypothetical protein